MSKQDIVNLTKEETLELINGDLNYPIKTFEKVDLIRGGKWILCHEYTDLIVRNVKTGKLYRCTYTNILGEKPFKDEEVEWVEVEEIETVITEYVKKDNTDD